MFLDDSVAHRKPQTRTFARGLGSEEWIVDFLDFLATDARALILHDYLDFRIDGLGPDPQLTAIRHCVAGIHK